MPSLRLKEPTALAQMPDANRPETLVVYGSFTTAAEGEKFIKDNDLGEGVD